MIETVLRSCHPKPAIASRYARLANVHLAAILTAEDQDEETGEKSPHDRLTCRIHLRWVHQCAHSPLHVIATTGHRWCRTCGIAADIAVDEIAGTVAIRCPRCLRAPDGPANRHTIAVCCMSIAAARSGTS